MAKEKTPIVLNSYKIVDMETATLYYLNRLANYYYQENWQQLVADEKARIKVIAEQQISRVKTCDGW